MYLMHSILWHIAPLCHYSPVKCFVFRTAPIHAEAPEFTDMSVEQEILVTGIKVVDLLAPYAKGGKIGMILFTCWCTLHFTCWCLFFFLSFHGTL